MALSLEDVYNLFEVKSLPGNEANLKTLVRWTNELVQEKGLEYVKTNRVRLLEQWEYIVTEMI